MLAKKGTSFLANAFRESYALFVFFSKVAGIARECCRGVDDPVSRSLHPSPGRHIHKCPFLICRTWSRSITAPMVQLIHKSIGRGEKKCIFYPSLI